VPNKTFDAWKAERFGTLMERTSLNSAALLGAKRLIFHYGLVVHELIGQADKMGCAEIPGDDFVIAGVGFSNGGFTADNQAAVILHELGHNVGRRHGGDANLDFQPNYVSVMNDSLTLAALNTDRDLDLSHLQFPWDETQVVESVGIPQGSQGLKTVWWAGPNASQKTTTDFHVDFNFDSVFGTQPIAIDLSQDGKTTVLLGGADWPNVHLNFRDVIDYGFATHLSMLSNVEVSSALYLNNSPDDDGDGVINMLDNCPFVPNPDQADANHNGIGDACEVQPTLRCITHKAGDVIAHFGYVNQNFALAVPVGAANALVGNAVVVSGEQPTVFQQGTHPDEFVVSFDHKETVTWTVNGISVTADNHARNCNALP
jgi:hypothetical protein